MNINKFKKKYPILSDLIALTAIVSIGLWIWIVIIYIAPLVKL